MKILITSNYAPPHGGVATVVYYLSKHLSLKGNKVTVVSFETGFDDLERYKCQVVRLKGIKILNDFFIAPWVYWQLFKEIKKQDIVFVHTPYFFISNIAALFGCLLRKKVICMCHGLVAINWRNFIHLKLMNILVNKWFFLNKGDVRNVKKYVGSLKPYALVTNGIEIDAYQQNKKIIQTSSKFIFVGRLEEEKGIKEMIEVVKALPQYQFGFIGDGPYRQSLEKFPNVRCYGYLTIADTKKTMADFNVLIFPSRTESFGLVVLEALALGLPVIVTCTNKWIKEIAEKNGIVVPIADANALITAVKKIITSPIKVSTDEIKKYDWKLIVHNYVANLH